MSKSFEAEVKRVLRETPNPFDEKIQKEKLKFETYESTLESLAYTLNVKFGFKDFELKIPYVDEKSISAFKSNSKADKWLANEVMKAIRNKGRR